MNKTIILSSFLTIVIGMVMIIIFGIELMKTNPELSRPNRETMSVDGYIIKEIDSCEYFMVHISSYGSGGCYLPVHKNNCKFCKEREKKQEAERRNLELKELAKLLGKSYN